MNYREKYTQFFWVFQERVWFNWVKTYFSKILSGIIGLVPILQYRMLLLFIICRLKVTVRSNLWVHFEIDAALRKEKQLRQEFFFYSLVHISPSFFWELIFCWNSCYFSECHFGSSNLTNFYSLISYCTLIKV